MVAGEGKVNCSCQDSHLKVKEEGGVMPRRKWRDSKCEERSRSRSVRKEAEKGMKKIRECEAGFLSREKGKKKEQGILGKERGKRVVQEK